MSHLRDKPCTVSGNRAGSCVTIQTHSEPHRYMRRLQGGAGLQEGGILTPSDLHQPELQETTAEHAPDRPSPTHTIKHMLTDSFKKCLTPSLTF